MVDETACAVWDPGSCEGTSSCPPRCPRFVAPDGTAYTIYRLGECPARRTDRVAVETGLDPTADLTGVLVQELAPERVECVAGVTGHARFGPMVTFGLGGVLVEHLDDVVHGLAPLSQSEARRVVHSVDAAAVFDGARGSDPVKVDTLAATLRRLSWLAVDYPALAELEVNPLVATPDGTVAVDFHPRLDGEE